MQDALDVAGAVLEESVAVPDATLDLGKPLAAAVAIVSIAPGLMDVNTASPWPSNELSEVFAAEPDGAPSVRLRVKEIVDTADPPIPPRLQLFDVVPPEALHDCPVKHNGVSVLPPDVVGDLQLRATLSVLLPGNVKLDVALPIVPHLDCGISGLTPPPEPLVTS